jgi:alpha-aminoadipic semialdehyde synthase
MTALVGIRREDKNRWERRVPLIPAQLKEVLSTGDLAAEVESMPNRVFSDAEYRAAGASVVDALGEADVVLAVKEIPVDLLRPGRAYVFFSHTIKGQPHNMPLLRQLLALGCTLIDYEKITDDAGRRLVLFGRNAGQAGMIDTLHLLGLRLVHEGLHTPAASVKMAYHYSDLKTTRAAFVTVAEQLAASGMPASLTPVMVGLAGYGNVSQGAQEVFDLLPHREITPDQLLTGEVPGDVPLAKVVFREEDMVIRTQGGADAFDLQEYYQHPERYEGRFERFLPHLHVLLNGIYWEERYPRLVTREALRALWSGDESPRLRVIGDVSCDVEGSIQATVKTTMPDDPGYVFDPLTETHSMGVAGRGPVIMAVDNLPAELSRESSIQFSESLKPYVGPIARARRDGPFDQYAVPPEIRRAVIVYNGELTPNFAHLRDAL